jgi:hypothetical protein
LKTNAKGRAWFYYEKLEKHTCFGSINYITTNAKGRAWFYYANSKKRTYFGRINFMLSQHN